MSFPENIPQLVAAGATFIVNHSGGKDSQAMFDLIWNTVPHKQIVVVYARLGRVVWDGVEEHIHATTRGVPVYTCAGRRDLLKMVEERGMFPSPKHRQCTSDLKRGPIEKTIRSLSVELIVNCMGMRAQESAKRGKLETFKLSERNSKAGRTWYEWLPIHNWTVEQVFDRIAQAGQTPHWAYAAGMTRLSCCFCIMASKEDLTTAARLNPSLYREYVELERKTGQVMMMPSKKHGRRTLEQITGIQAAEKVLA